MYNAIYVESEVLEQPLTQTIVSRFPTADIIECGRYTEIFNRRGQDFRIQKQNLSLILARKHDNHVLPAPNGYGVGGRYNYYFSMMLNCVYDCRYCFLQGMYQSAHHVVFVNYADFSSAIESTASKHDDKEQVWFFSGYDCDSLAMEPVVGAAAYLMESVKWRTNSWLELRTKSTQIRSLLDCEPLPNVVVAFSLTPDRISASLEHKVPQVEKRLAAMLRLQERGWKIGLRFDPLIFASDYKIQYRSLFENLFENLDLDLLHSISVGVFRLPRNFYKKIERLYPEDKFIAQPFVQQNGQITYPGQIDSEMKDWCYQELNRYIDQKRIFSAEFLSESQ